jgi:hypothetical protein
MKSILIGILVGVALSVIFFVLTVVSDGACHCVKPTIIFFPYAAVALSRSLESASLALMLIQFPVYSVVVAKVGRGGWKIVALLILLVFHGVAAVVGLQLYHQ